jgi:hypothetical protein
VRETEKVREMKMGRKMREREISERRWRNRDKQYTVLAH